MALSSTQGLEFKLVANDIILDLFRDEQIVLSDNVTGLFDLGIIPADFTRQITLPGTKKNDAFFEQVYDISVISPDTFSTNQKVECYLDFGGIYLAQGYLQLNKVNVLANKWVDSYEISIYGAISSFAREVNRTFLTDMTGSLARFDHTSSLENIQLSWNRELFDGDIVYPFAEYGQRIQYAPENNTFGIDNPSGSLFVQDYKPAIRVKRVWDAIFNQYGYTYSSSFWEQPFLDNVYMVCNNQLRYPIYDEVDLETYGLIKIGPVSGSTDVQMVANAEAVLPWYNIQENPAFNISPTLVYSLDYGTKIKGILNLNIKVTNTGVGVGVPQFSLVFRSGGPFSGGFGSGFTQGTSFTSIPLTSINEYFVNLQAGYQSQNIRTATQKHLLQTEFTTDYLLQGDYNFYLVYTPLGGTNFTVTLDPDGELKSNLQITKVGNVGEGFVMKIGQNMPFGTNGIKQIDFLTSIQKKFNLVIYPSKTKRNEFIVETFKEWYKKGQLWDFNKYINLDNTIEVIPANNLAVNELNFGDTLDGDYISQQFSKLSNREYGKSYYVDTQNFFSQGTFEVKTGLASSPLTYLQGTGVSGSQDLNLGYFVSVDDEYVSEQPSSCTLGGSQTFDEIHRTTVRLLNVAGNSVTNDGPTISVNVRYNFVPCFGSPFTQLIAINIPFGASQGTFTYFSSQYVDCGQFSCELETITIDCVQGVTGAQLSNVSPITAC
jgi:hypothetical protein